MADPLSDGAVKLTVACPAPAVADTPVGADGAVAAVLLALVVAWAALVDPLAAVAVTEK